MLKNLNFVMPVFSEERGDVRHKYQTLPTAYKFTYQSISPAGHHRIQGLCLF